MERRDNFEVVLTAVRQSAWTLKFASERLRGNLEVVLAATTRRDGDVLKFASKTLRGDCEAMAAIIRASSGYVFKYASKALRGDPKLLRLALQTDDRALEFASEELRGDREIVLEAVRARANRERNYGLDPCQRRNNHPFSYATEELRQDRDFVLKAVATQGECLHFAATELKTDRELVEIAVKQIPFAISAYSPEVKNLRDIFRKAAEFIADLGPGAWDDENPQPVPNPFLLQVQKEQSISLAAGRNGFNFLNWLRPCCRCQAVDIDKDFLYEAVRRANQAPEWIPWEYRRDQEFYRRVCSPLGDAGRDRVPLVHATLDRQDEALHCTATFASGRSMTCSLPSETFRRIFLTFPTSGAEETEQDSTTAASTTTLTAEDGSRPLLSFVH